MRYAILDSCYPLKNGQQHARGMGASYLQWELERRGIEESRPDQAGVILVSCVSCEAALFLARIRKAYASAVIVAGGPASTSPHSLGVHADMVCVGDGQAFVASLIERGLDAAASLPNVWIHGNDRGVLVDHGFPWAMPPVRGEDGAFRVYCGRGCKNKCVFCQTGWAYKYSENPDPQLLTSQIRAITGRGDKVAYLSNDAAQHSFFHSLPPTGHGSYSLGHLRQFGLPPARQIRIGVEGVSARLRDAVGKPISHDDLVGCTSWLNRNGKSVRWFMIAGLPGETHGDWEELKAAVMDWKKVTPKGVLEISFTAWCPDPATPIACLPLDDSYWDRYAAFSEWFFAGKGWSNRIKLWKPQQPKSLRLKAAFSMGKSEENLYDNSGYGPNDRVEFPFKALRHKALARYLGIMGISR